MRDNGVLMVVAGDNYLLANPYRRFGETLCLHFLPKDGGRRFLRNDGNDLLDYTAPHPRIQ
jgi:hypothetical protein